MPVQCDLVGNSLFHKNNINKIRNPKKIVIHTIYLENLYLDNPLSPALSNLN